MTPMSQAVDTLSAQYGTLFVIAAGNGGPGDHLRAGRSREAALTVGADRQAQDSLAWFSSTGPLDQHRGDEAGPGRAGGGHHRRALAGLERRRHRPVHDDERHLDGHAPRRRLGGDRGPAAPPLDR